MSFDPEAEAMNKRYRLFVAATIQDWFAARRVWVGPGEQAACQAAHHALDELLLTESHTEADAQKDKPRNK